MTKRDLIDEVNKRFPHLSRRDSEVIINAIFDSMVDALAQGDRIEIRGFGSFVVKHRRPDRDATPRAALWSRWPPNECRFSKSAKSLDSEWTIKSPGLKRYPNEAALGPVENDLHR